ncbi:MAG TPA: lysylphosphatidylglycerol synthase domain-containing protein [Taishania sp.]|nr:lysylphosphatidylglycerol synthase domain-containing protein [Taishania sp.]
MKIILTFLVGYFSYLQIRKLGTNGIQKLTITSPVYLILAIILVVPNYFFEYRKWNLIIKVCNVESTVQQKIQSFFAGIITGMLTPNMQGNFLGRIFYYPREHRISLTLFTLTSNLGQFIATILLGIISLVIIKPENSINTFILLISFCIAVILLYGFFERIQLFKHKFRWFERFSILLLKNNDFRLKILLYSLFRNGVFSLQYLLVLKALGVEINLEIYWKIWELYLWTTLSPSLFLGKLFIRESIALWVFAPMQIDPWVIVANSVIVWIINLLLPTLVGLLIAKRRKEAL